MKRALAVVLTLAALASPARAQTLQDVVAKQKTTVAAKIEAAKLPDDLKAAFRAKLAKASTGSLDAQFANIERLEGDISNNERAWGEWSRVDTYIRGLQGVTPKLRDYYTGLMTNARTSNLPDHTAELWGRVGSLKSGIDNFVPLIKEIQAYMAALAANARIPALMKSQVTARLQRVIDGMGTAGATSSTSDWNSLADAKTFVAQQTVTLDEMDKLIARVAKEAPATYPEFLANTRAEVERLRKDVGNSQGNTPLSFVDDMNVTVSRRLPYLKYLAEIKAKIPLLPEEDRPSYQRTHDKYLVDLVGWRTGTMNETDRIMRLHSNLMDRFR
jgi:hypothetical protein